MIRDPYEPYEGGGGSNDVTGFTAQELDGRTLAEQRAADIAQCQLCDQHGYRRGTATVCDHIDHAAIAERHRGEIAAQLAQIRHRKQPPTQSPERSPREP
jgi:hypothetical protein